MAVARQIGAGIEFVFKWFGLVLMPAALIAVIAIDPPAATLASSSQFVPPASAGAR